MVNFNEKMAMDKFRIYYRCYQAPEVTSGLKGFFPEKSYIGRAYNGLFEISENWGSDNPTKIVDRKVFERYFELQQPN